MVKGAVRYGQRYSKLSKTYCAGGNVAGMVGDSRCAARVHDMVGRALLRRPHSRRSLYVSLYGCLHVSLYVS